MVELEILGSTMARSGGLGRQASFSPPWPFQRENGERAIRARCNFTDSEAEQCAPVFQSAPGVGARS